MRLEDGTTYLLRGARRRGEHHDAFVWDLFFRLDACKSDLAPFGSPEYVAGFDLEVASKVTLKVRKPKVPGVTLTLRKEYSAIAVEVKF